MDRAWCYLCRVESGGADARAAWGLDLPDVTGDDRGSAGDPMSGIRASYLRFLCGEFGYPFDDSLRDGEAGLLIESFLDEPTTPQQRRTLEWLSRDREDGVEEHLTYGEARDRIRRLVAARALRSSA